MARTIAVPVFISIATLFAVLELTMLLAACVGQFDPAFSSKEAIGAIGSAFISAVLGSVFSIGAMLIPDSRNAWGKRLLAIIWGGFALLIIIGITAHEFATNARTP